MSRIGDACWIEFQKLLKFFGSFFLFCNILTLSIVSKVRGGDSNALDPNRDKEFYRDL